MWLSFFLAAAAAQGFDVAPGWAVEPAPGTFYERGVGAPTVAWVEHPGVLVMFFETQVAPPDARCPQGKWAIGAASSRDGRSWTVNPHPVVEPEEGTFFSCTAAHPSVVWDGRWLNLWFKAEQASDACAAGAPAWGCGKQSGVGYVRIPNRTGRGNPALKPADAPVLAVAGFGYPSVVRSGDAWHLLLAKVPNVWHATASSPEGPWTFDAKNAIKPGFADWATDRVYDPSLLCAGDGFEVFAGGRVLEGTTTVYGGWGHGASADGRAWDIEPEPIFDWADPDLWQHWEVLSAGGDYVAWFSQIDPKGTSRIGTAWTDPGFSTRALGGKSCR